jgi:hypothetical protein
MALRWPFKDPDDTLDYSIDWSRFLRGQLISSAQWFFYTSDGVKTLVGDGVSIDGLISGSQSNTNTVTTIVLAGGDRNKDYRVTCSINFGDGLVAERTVRIRVRDGA